MQTHNDLPVPFRCFVKNKYFYNGQQIEKTPYTRCTIFAVTSYEGSLPTVIVRVDNGSVFHYIPIHALSTKQDEIDFLPFNKLVYANCPSNKCVLNVHSFLIGSTTCFFRKKSGFDTYGGTYIATLDWPVDNLNMHLIVLDNGQYCILPNHKVLFRASGELPAYQKMRMHFGLPDLKD